MKRKSIIISILVSTLLGAAILKLAQNKSKIDKDTSYHEVIENVPVQVQTATTNNLNTELHFVGTFLASKEAPVSVEIQGKIARTFVNEGDFVTEGQVIAELDQSLLILKLEADEVQYEHSKEDLLRYENLSKKEATSDISLKQMRLTNSLNEIAVKNTKEQIAKCKIKASISGYLTMKDFEVGTVVSPGIPIGHVTNINTLKFAAMVPEHDVVKLELNQKVNVTADVFRNATHTGVISQIAEKGDEKHNYKVEVYINNDNKQFPLKAGMNGSMVVNDKNTVTGIFISRDALQGNMLKPQVYLVKSNRAVLKNIVTGISSGNDIQILDGIREGDKVITTGMNSLKDSTTVKIVSLK